MSQINPSSRRWIKPALILGLILLLTVPALWFRDDVLNRPELDPNRITTALSSRSPEPTAEVEEPAETPTPEDPTVPERLSSAEELNASEHGFAGQAKKLPASGGDPDAADQVIITKLEEAIAGGVGMTHLAVADAHTGQPIWQYQDEPASPMSLIKTLTAMYVLETLGPEYRFETFVKLTENGDEVQLTLIGNGDSLLSNKQVEELAQETAAALRELGDGSAGVTVTVDDSAFAGPALFPEWSPELVSSGNIAPLRPATMYGGREQSGTGTERTGRDPNLILAERFRAALMDALPDSGDITVRPLPSELVVETDAKAQEVAAVESVKVSTQVKYALQHSDNQVTETLMRGALVAQGREASNETVVAELTEYVRGFVPEEDAENITIKDASGLNPYSAVSATTLNNLLLTVIQANEPDNPRQAEAAAVVEGLAVAGESGTLENRFGGDGDNATVRGKTGSLLHATGLSAVVETGDREFVMTVVIDQALGQTDAARVKLDNIFRQLF